jgi:hypothetical protein
LGMSAYSVRRRRVLRPGCGGHVRHRGCLLRQPGDAEGGGVRGGYAAQGAARPRRASCRGRRARSGGRGGTGHPPALATRYRGGDVGAPAGGSRFSSPCGSVGTPPSAPFGSASRISWQAVAGLQIRSSTQSPLLASKSLSSFTVPEWSRAWCREIARTRAVSERS